MSGKLLSCPFCGGKAICSNWGMWRAWCSECKSKGSDELTEKEAIAAWNRRVQPENEPLTLEQLREMDGEPVWLKDGIGEGWFLAGAVVGSKIYFCEKSITVGEPITGCGKTWLAYRRPPQKG